MSNAVAISAVTSTICYVLEQSLAAQPGAMPQAKVTTLSPQELGASMVADSMTLGLNVFLYEVAPSPGLRKPHLPMRWGDGHFSSGTVTSVDLRYLVTAYGQDPYLGPHRLTARAVLALSANAILTGELVAAALVDFAARSGLEFLADADLADQVEPVRLAPEVLTLDEIGRLWAIFRAPYLLSLGYRVDAVALETE